MKNLQKRQEVVGTHVSMLIIIFSLGVANFIWGEKVPAYDGLGWDGVGYATIVKDYHEMMRDPKLSYYLAQRIFPSTIVGVLLDGLQIPKNNPNIIALFEIYNLSLLLLSGLAWWSISDRLKLQVISRWIGFGGIFLNFEFSKHAFYYPVSTDVSALTISIFMLKFAMERRVFGLFVVTVIGAFCWPVAGLCGAVLIAFVKANDCGLDLTHKPPFQVVVKGVGVGAIIWPILVFSFLLILLLESFLPVDELLCIEFNSLIKEYAPFLPNQAQDKLRNLLVQYPCGLNQLIVRTQRFATALPCLIAVFVMLRSVFKPMLNPVFFGAVFAIKNLSCFLLAVVSLVIPLFVQKLISNPVLPNENSFGMLVQQIVCPPNGKLMLPAVGFIVLWGPLALLALLFWRRIFLKASLLGYGVVFIIALHSCLALANEPRYILFGWPFMVVCVSLICDEIIITREFRFLLLTATVLFGQFWLKINIGPWASGDYDLLRFPKQLYFLHYGLFMDWPAYLIQGSCILIFFILLKRYLGPDVFRARL